MCAAAVLGIGIMLSGVRPFTGTGNVTPVSPVSPVSSGALFSLLPRSVQQAGKLTVGTTTDSAPMVFTSDGKLTGLDTDLLNAMAGRLGISFNYTRGDRGSLVDDVSTGRVDVAAAGFADTPSRLRRVDFVDYFTAGSAVTVAAANPGNVHSLADLCGKKVAVVAGGTDAETLAARNCAAGPIRIASVSTPMHALESVRTGEADAAFTDFPSADFAAGQPDSRLAVAGRQIAPGPYGFAVSKSDPQLRQALAAALDAIIDDGTYGRILTKYHLTEGAVSSARINGGR
jgi:polar amino acid transport system substrate-binding protein